MLIMSVANILQSEPFLTFGVAIAAMAIGVLAKAISRVRSRKKDLIGDLAIGIDLQVTSLFVLITKSVDYSVSFDKSGLDEMLGVAINDQLVVRFWILILFIAVLFGTSLWVRLRGRTQKDRLRVFSGILLPNIIGITSLVFVSIKF